MIRTDYGVPHIYADNFQALGYALGYLQLEDYGDRVPIGMIRARGELARYEGRRALNSDFESRPYYLLAIEVYSQLEQDTRDVYEGFAAGVNRYVERHADEFLPWMEPNFTGYDVAALYVYRTNPRQIRRWIQRIQGTDTAVSIDPDENPDADSAIEEGSSAWALAPSRTTSNAAILMRNPHLGWDAGYWEVHAVMPGRLDFYGDFRIGGPLGIIGGFNRQLGFATTNNSANRTEVYRLEADPNREDYYLFNGTSMPLIKDELMIPYLDGEVLRTETRQRVSTHIGPVIHQQDGQIYVMRTAEDGEFRAGEQFLKLIQATNLEEWRDAMQLRAHPSSNFTYAGCRGQHLLHMECGHSSKTSSGRRGSSRPRLTYRRNLDRASRSGFPASIAESDGRLHPR